ncbi:hypothetical protein VE00_03338 [Pseudogymnoascus sp. WSF 3629]|nr:hypothetical protein VE00_03338 [Pseudogymnoascus sp. WSF 3629]
MNFFGFPIEIRLMIYPELLVHSEPIDFVVDYGPPSPHQFRLRRYGLSPALLRVNKALHSEASPFLYSNNRFRFSDIFTSTPSATYSAHIAPFLGQIGSQARLIRHICMTFPTFDDYQHGRARLHEAHIKNLDLIRDTCITTLELLILPDCALNDSPVVAEALDLLDARFKTISSLKEIIVNVYGGKDISDLIKKMRDYRWTVVFTKLPKYVWISYDNRVEFDNEDDWNRYNNEQHPLQLTERAGGGARVVEGGLLPEET